MWNARDPGTGPRAYRVNREWTFAVISACQEFVCQAGMDGPLDGAISQAEALRDAIPPSPEPLAERFLRATLFEISLRWGAEQHRRLAHKCRRDPCPVRALMDGARFWSDVEHGNAGAAHVFVAHVTAITEEFQLAHGDSLAERAIALFQKRGGAVSIEDAAHILRTHPSTLRRAFKRETGTSPREFLARVRLARAEALLLEGDGVKVEPVAHAVGWSSKGGLYRAFRHYRGGTPGQARALQGP